MRATGDPAMDDGYGAPKPKAYTNLDLIKADTPHTTAKISRMLHQLEYKLQVEMQYKKGIDKMAKLYQADGDKKSRADAESKKVESERKIQLLQSALKRYKNLHILDDADEDEDGGSSGPIGPGVDGERKDNLRSKPLSGKLQVTLKGARELDHAPIVATGRMRSTSKPVETYVALKVEGTQRARSHPSRTDRWMEDFEITIDKANEVELAVYDKQVGELHPVPIGLLWIKISDLVEAQRRQKVMIESGQGGWVTAGAMNNDGAAMGIPGQAGGAGGMDSPIGFGDNRVVPPGAPMPGGGQSEGIDAWFAVEPAGAVALHLNFVKENVRKRPLDTPGGLGRQGAVRKRKDEVHEMNGHKFVQRQFYQIILCAFCNEFLLNAVGYQCEDCRPTPATMTRRKSTIAYLTVSSPSLTLARIGVATVATCSRLVARTPGDARSATSPATRILLRDWRDINKARGGRQATQARTSHPPAAQQYIPSALTPVDTQMEHLGGDMERMKLEAQQKMAEYGYREVPSPEQQRVSQLTPMVPYPPQISPPAGRPSPGGRPPVSPAFPTEPSQPQALPGRPVSGAYEMQPGVDAYQKALPAYPSKQPTVLPVAPVQAMPPRIAAPERQSGSADTSNFDEEFTKEQPTLTPVHTQLSSRDQAEFNGFSWVAGWADV
ncbi:Protein kinase C-like protein [Grifola frondosa]|uniref:Protein kinase C-like protein n=1 Tax=Grifola frondosa TaxID=5627 RepID=A0A1C7LXN1_GRIFR|nr:Protein kinase C-like protein [Grifola frondosa]